METGVQTQSKRNNTTSRWYSASTWLALLIILIYVVFTFAFPLIPIAIIAGAMQHLVLYVVPVVGTIIWLMALAFRILVRKNKRQLIWTAFRYGIIAFGGAGLLMMLMSSATPGYIRATEQFHRQMKREADIPAIRVWAEAFPPP